MLVIYGWKSKLKVDKQLGNKHCPNCNHDEEMSLARDIFKIHIFGIPVFKMVKKRMVMCNNCGIAEELSKYEYKQRLEENG